MACFHSSLVLHDFFFSYNKTFRQSIRFRTFVSYFTGALADLPVGFPYRFNSSYYYHYNFFFLCVCDVGMYIIYVNAFYFTMSMCIIAFQKLIAIKNLNLNLNLNLYRLLPPELPSVRITFISIPGKGRPVSKSFIVSFLCTILAHIACVSVDP